MTDLMKAMVIEDFGDSSCFKLADVSKPTIQQGQALIQVTHSSVNPLDIKIRQGMVQPVGSFPLILNAEVVGTIVQVNDPSGHLQIGDQVFGVAGGIGGKQGALASLMVADCNLLGKLPSKLSNEQAAGLALVGITASLALEKCAIRANSNVLIHGGAGGVGHIAVQLAAKRYQAKVFATVGSEQEAKLIQQLGATDTANFREETVAHYVERLTHNQGFDIIFDTVGQNNLINSFEAVANYGHVITTAARLELDLSPLHAKSADLHVVFMMLPIINGANDNRYQILLENLAQDLMNGELTLLSNEKIYGFTEIAQAHDDLMARKTHGKIKLKNDLE